MKKSLAGLWTSFWMLSGVVAHAVPAATLPPNQIIEERARKEDAKKDCPFASKNGQFAGLREQLRSLTALLTTTESSNNPRCAQLANSFKSSSELYTSITRALDYDPDKGNVRAITAEETRARQAASDALTNLLNAGCTMQNPSKVLEGALVLMDSLAGGVIASGYVYPQNFAIGLGIQAASRLGLAISRWLTSTPKEFDKLRSEMKTDAFRDQLCLFRNIYYKIDEMDPGASYAVRRKSEIETQLAKNRESAKTLEASCAPEADAKVVKTAEWFNTIKTELEGAGQEKDGLARCQRFRYLIGAQTERIADTADKIGCDGEPSTLKQKSYCSSWKRVREAMKSDNLCFNGSADQQLLNAEFQEKASFILQNTVAVMTELAASKVKNSPDAFAAYRKLREATQALEAESKALDDPNLVLTEYDRAQANSMVRELGKLMIRDGLPQYAKFARDNAKEDYGRARSALKRGKDKCANAKFAWNQVRTVRPRLNSIQQICTTLGGSNGAPIPAFRDASRDFNTVTGEESRRRRMLFGAPRSPLQAVCGVGQDPDDEELSKFESSVVKTWIQNCPADVPPPATEVMASP